MINIEFTPSHPDADAGGSGRPPDRATPVARPDRLPAQTDPADQARLARLEEALSLPAAAPGEQRGSDSQAREEETAADRAAERLKLGDQLAMDFVGNAPTNPAYRIPGGFLVNAIFHLAPAMEAGEEVFTETKKILEAAGVRVRDDPEAQQARRREAEAKREQAFQQSSVGQAVQRFVPFRFLRELLLAILQGRSPEAQPSAQEQEEAAEEPRLSGHAIELHRLYRGMRARRPGYSYAAYVRDLADSIKRSGEPQPVSFKRVAELARTWQEQRGIPAEIPSHRA